MTLDIANSLVNTHIYIYILYIYDIYIYIKPYLSRQRNMRPWSLEPHAEATSCAELQRAAQASVQEAQALNTKWD